MSGGVANRGWAVDSNPETVSGKPFFIALLLAVMAVVLLAIGVIEVDQRSLVLAGGLVGGKKAKAMGKAYVKTKILGWIKAIILRYLTVPVLIVILLLALVLGVTAASQQANACGGVGVGATTTATMADLGPAQMNNAATIIATANAQGLGREGAIVGLVTAAQESVFQNYYSTRIPETRISPDQPAGSDHFSAGIFQQQTGPFGDYWGTPTQVVDPVYATERFFRELLEKVPDRAQWAADPGGAAQTVQSSAFPDAYDKHIPLANQLIDAIQPNISVAPGGAAAAGCGAGSATGLVAPGTWVSPAQGRFTSGFGARWGTQHKGVDIANATGTPVVAASNGVVVDAGMNVQGFGGYGGIVHIEHPKPPGGEGGPAVTTLYAHNSRLLVAPGQVVQGGQQIAEMGSTGDSTGPHLHFEVRVAGEAQDPVPFLSGLGVNLGPQQ